MIFITSVIVIEICFYAYRIIRNPHLGTVRRRLKTYSTNEFESEITDILEKKLLSDVPSLNRILLQVPGVQRLDRLLKQANVQHRLGVLVLLTLLLMSIGYLGSSLVPINRALSLVAAALSGSIPILFVRLKKKQRMQKFQRQLPDGLGLIARALRAGHAFSSGMKLAADEFDDPLGPEFYRTLDEINFGVSIADALRNLARRVDCPDLKYFVVSVILQHETGGNLAEIIDSIAYIIRERFKFKGKVQVLSAEGKLSARILIALPFLVILALRYLNPEYMKVLFHDPMGRLIAGIAAFMMVLGIVFIRKMVEIKV
jgi:tight adherence protein B